MGILWTDEQKKVIESRRKNVLVSAAAGSGKTAVLAARILSRILDPSDPTDIDRILVVTFTNAAAAEMRERIRKSISKALEEDPDNEHLKRQGTLLHHALITTYDSFCLYLVRNYFHRIDLDPSVRVADPGEITLLKEEVLDRVLEEEYGEAKEDFSLFLESFGSRRSDEGVRDMVRKLAVFAESYPWPKEWLMSCRRVHHIETTEELLSSDFIKGLMKNLQSRFRGYSEELYVLSEISGDPDGPNVYCEVLSKEAEMMTDFAVIDSYLNLRAAFLAREDARLPSARNYHGSEEKKQYVSDERRRIKTELKKMESDFFARIPEEMLRRMQEAGQNAEVLFRMTERFLLLFREAKRERNMVDFSDMEHDALRILVDPETKQPTDVAEKYREFFSEVMVDEYQDSNFLQEEILRAVTRQKDGEKNLFLVGDVKQSIYRFRLSRPELFMEKYRNYPVEGPFEERIDLHKNFRSRSGILGAVNDLFFRLMGEDLGNVEYDSDAALYPGAEYPENPEENVRFLLTDEAEGKERLEREGQLIAREIRRLIKEEHVTGEDQKLRPIRFSDIVILLRSPGGSGDELCRILKDQGIPAQRPSETGYFKAQEVQVLLAFLSVIDNPCQDIPLTTVLRSPIGGFSDEALARIRLYSKEKFFYECVQESDETKDFMQMLNSFRDRAKDTRVHALITEILSETGYLSYVTALPGGQVRRANLMALIERAVAYEKTSYHGLYHFVRYMENIRKYEVDFGEADPAAGDTDAVRILSIHKSKGLEFPVVFLSETGKKFNRSDEREKLVIHPEYGVGLAAVDGKKRTRSNTIFRESIELFLRTENLGEELRVLYVALTRAKEKLIVTGCCKDAISRIALAREAMRKPGDGLFSYDKRAKAGNYLDWLLPGFCAENEKYHVDYISPEQLEGEAAARDLSTAVTREAVEERLLSGDGKRERLERMDWVYPHLEERDIRAKVSVSELKHQAMLFEEGDSSDMKWIEKTKHPLCVPHFASDGSEKNLGAERGSAVHRVMECLDFAGLKEVLSLDSAGQTAWAGQEIRVMREKGLITAEMEKLVSPRFVAAFLSSPLARRMHEAALRGELYKEKPFVMGLPAADVYHVKSDEIILVQGIIDVFFREGEDYVIMDYKTDSVKTASELEGRYKAQLDLYADAVARNKQCSIKEKLIYSFHLGETIRIQEGT